MHFPHTSIFCQTCTILSLYPLIGYSSRLCLQTAASFNYLEFNYPMKNFGWRVGFDDQAIQLIRASLSFLVRGSSDFSLPMILKEWERRVCIHCVNRVPREVLIRPVLVKALIRGLMTCKSSAKQCQWTLKMSFFYTLKIIKLPVVFNGSTKQTHIHTYYTLFMNLKNRTLQLFQ